MFQKYILKKLVQSKLKGLPEDQVDMILEVVTKNPDFFKKIQHEIDAKKKSGISEQAAVMTVLRENQSELQRLFQASK